MDKHDMLASLPKGILKALLVPLKAQLFTAGRYFSSRLLKTKQ